MGRPKALISVAGEPLVLRVVRVAGAVSDEVVVVANGPQARPIKRILPAGVEVAIDRGGVQSPLTALSTGAGVVSSEYVAFLPCDLPFLMPAVLGTLFQAAVGRDAAIPRWPDGRIEPMVAVYRRSSAGDAATQALESGERANTDMIKRLTDVAYVPTDELRGADPGLVSFFNVNTPEDLARAEERLRSR